MCKETLFRIYELSLRDGGTRSQVLEQLLQDSNSGVLTVDDERNAPEMYARLFGGECRPTVEALLLALMRGMKERTFEEAHDGIQALSFLQTVAATALWKYRLDVGSRLEEFAREFDRLDVESERVRLHEYTQSMA